MSTVSVEPMIDSIHWVLTTLAAVVLILRVYSKDKRRTPLWWDDYLMMVSWTLLLSLTITCAFAAHHGAGRHMTDLDVSTMQTFSLSEAVASTTSIAVASLSKTGFAATLVQSSKGWPRAVAWMTIIVVNITAGTVALLLWLQCTPLRKVFVILDYGYCWPDSVRTTSQILNSFVSGTADIVLSLTAVYVVYIKTTKKGYWAGAWFCASLGLSAGMASFSKAALTYTFAGDDLSYNSVNVMIWGVVEPATIIIAGSLPELRNLIWKQPSSIPYHHGDTSRSKRNAILFQEDFDYVLQQYMEAGSKTFRSQFASRASMQWKPSESKWWV